MFYSIQDGKLNELDTTRRVENVEQSLIGIIEIGDIYDVAAGLGISNFRKIFSDNTERYVACGNYDLICIDMVDSDTLTARIPVYIYIGNNLLLFISKDIDRTKNYVNAVAAQYMENESLRLVAQKFIDMVIESEIPSLEKIKEKVSFLEDVLFEKDKSESVKDILMLEKSLGIIKNYCESKLNLLDGINNFEADEVTEMSLLTSDRVVAVYYEAIDTKEYIDKIAKAYDSESVIKNNLKCGEIIKYMKIFISLLGVVAAAEILKIIITIIQ